MSHIGLKKSLSLLSILVLYQMQPLTINAQQLDIAPSALQQIEALLQEKASRTTAQRKIGSALLYALKQDRQDALLQNLPELRSQVTVNLDGSVLVDINAEVNLQLLNHIQDLGGVVINEFPQYRAIRARIPLAALEALASEQEVRSIRPADRAVTNKINTSQGDVAHAANVARTTYSVSGAGVKACVLSDAVDSLATLQSSGDLPAVTVLPGQAGSDGSEGTAMLEIVYDLAPGTALYFATAFNGQASFAQNIKDLRFNYDCDVIVDDIFYFSESPFQDGIIAQAVNDVTADGALYFSSAGNSGNLNDGTSGTWEGDYAATSLPSPLTGMEYDSAHNFGGQNFNTITDDPPFGIALFWSDPLGGSSNDYDLFLLNSARTSVVGFSTTVQDGSQDPFEFINSEGTDDTGNTLIIARWSGVNRFLHLSTIRGKLSKATAGETKGHAVAADAFGVAAVDVGTASGGLFTGGAANPVEVFSSDGPRRMFYEPDGTPYTPGNVSSTGGIVRQKPDIAAADGVATATPGFNPFFGTSAAAPHAAAIAALMLDQDPTLIVSEVRNLFASTALDIEAAGMDRDSGYGIIAADLLLEALNACIATFTDVACDYWAWISVEAIVQAGITSGCGGGKYCPLSPVTRAQMAVFLLRGIHGGDYFPPPATGTKFLDVPLGSFAAAWVEQLAKEGITSGCGGGKYCPSSSVTRAQLAIFLLRAKHGDVYQPPAATGTMFSDVPLGSFAAAWIEQLAREGITGGCGSGKYCPANAVQRDQMAVFLERTFNLL